MEAPWFGRENEVYVEICTETAGYHAFRESTVSGHVYDMIRADIHLGLHAIRRRVVCHGLSQCSNPFPTIFTFRGPAPLRPVVIRIQPVQSHRAGMERQFNLVIEDIGH